MAKKMHAAVVTAFGKPLQLQEWDVPTPGPGQILVKTEACGVCHTDLHAANGDWPAKPTPPFIPGHEAIGIVVALGAGVTLVKEGDRVGVPWLYSACGHCEYCLSAWETVCPEAKYGGYTQNGGFAEYLLGDPNYVAHIPMKLSPTEAAPLICAGITTYKGIKETEARPGEWIAVSGCGGLGHMAIQYAKAMGLHVCAVDIDDGKLDHAKRLGADMVVNAKTQDPAAMLKAAIGGGAHGVLITAPSLPAFKQGVEMTRKRGTCVLVGLPPGNFPTPLFDVVANCITIRGSFVGTREDMAECLQFAAEGKVKADIELQPLASINSVLERLEKGEVPSRVVLDLTGGTTEKPKAEVRQPASA
ncbi:zinc-dependent alcohol dehydrogenase (plasmid) [Polymorphobacter megasporae]|nr:MULTISPECIES: zinc-dependent alcohol dehydrogenase [Polymorphobacter]QYE33596.1 zinc-dependent alcohol dehydrogenase [Polymorphobacter sp. PAMC 29334]UAJ12902.1 zinc-dependent alcohol dehydrogenase [Polymorphobacter megasporae]